MFPTSESLRRIVKLIGGDTAFFVLERTACFGTCPTYRLTINGDGKAYYEGRRFVPREGRYAGQVDAAKMKALGAQDASDVPQSTRTRGTLTVTTDGEILTNNTENGPTRSPGGRSLSWSIDSSSEKVPEALVQLQ